MGKRFGIGLLVVLAALGLGAVFWKGVLFPTNSWRYKMTVSVETPEGIKTGSAVREVSVTDNPKITPETIPHIEIKGEAVVVDLGKRGVLFAIMKNSLGPDYTHHVVYKTIGGSTSPEGIRYLQNATGKKAVLEPEDYPVLVMFKDINDPKTVTPVLELGNNPKPPFSQIMKADHFEELFGTGVKLKEIAIEMTDEKVTWGVEKYLPETFSNIVVDGWRQLSLDERRRLSDLLYFKNGGQK